MSDMYKDLKNTIQSLSTLGDDLALKTLKDLQEAIKDSTYICTEDGDDGDDDCLWW